MGRLSAILDKLDAWTGATPRATRRPARSSFPSMSFQDYVDWVTSGTGRFPFVQTQKGGTETIGDSFVDYVHGAYQANGIVFACMLARFSLFSEARFQFRRYVDGRPAELFGGQELAPLERPMPGQTTGDLLTRMLVYSDLAGNAFVVRDETGIHNLRPDWTTMVLGSNAPPVQREQDVAGELLGVIHHPGGKASGSDPIVYLRSKREVAHFAPYPDPLSPYRGMSWLTPIVREIMGDSATTNHKLRFFENGATPNIIVTFDPSVSQDSYDLWVDKYEEANKGSRNAYKTMYLGGGSTADVVGSSLHEMDFKVTQGAGETRIAAAAGVPPVIAGFSEGLAAATYSNYGQARRRLADLTMRPLWRNAAGSLAALIEEPAGSQLWYDDRDIPFLQEDMKDGAVIVQTQAQAIRTLVEAGYTPDSARTAVLSGNLDLLQHTGLFSVQLQPPGADMSATDPARSLAAMLAPYLAQREAPVVHVTTAAPTATERPDVDAAIAQRARIEAIRASNAETHERLVA